MQAGDIRPEGGVKEINGVACFAKDNEVSVREESGEPAADVCQSEDEETECREEEAIAHDEEGDMVGKLNGKDEEQNSGHDKGVAETVAPG